VIIITDPDWILLQPFDIRGVERGKPLSGYGTDPAVFRHDSQWIRHCGTLCNNISDTAWSGYAIGQVNVAHKEDMKRLTTSWVKWSMKLRDIRDGSISVLSKAIGKDTLGYILGAIENRMPHVIRTFFDISSAMEPKVNYHAVFQALHYNQDYTIGKWAWSKRIHTSSEFLACFGDIYLGLPPDTNETNMYSLSMTTHQFYFTLATKLNRAFAKYKKKSLWSIDNIDFLTKLVHRHS